MKLKNSSVYLIGINFHFYLVSLKAGERNGWWWTRTQYLKLSPNCSELIPEHCPKFIGPKKPTSRTWHLLMSASPVKTWSESWTNNCKISTFNHNLIFWKFWHNNGWSFKPKIRHSFVALLSYIVSSIWF